MEADNGFINFLADALPTVPTCLVRISAIIGIAPTG